MSCAILQAWSEVIESFYTIECGILEENKDDESLYTAEYGILKEDDEFVKKMSAAYSVLHEKMPHKNRGTMKELKELRDTVNDFLSLGYCAHFLKMCFEKTRGEKCECDICEGINKCECLCEYAYVSDDDSDCDSVDSNKNSKRDSVDSGNSSSDEGMLGINCYGCKKDILYCTCDIDYITRTCLYCNDKDDSSTCEECDDQVWNCIPVKNKVIIVEVLSDIDEEIFSNESKRSVKRASKRKRTIIHKHKYYHDDAYANERRRVARRENKRENGRKRNDERECKRTFMENEFESE